MSKWPLLIVSVLAASATMTTQAVGQQTARYDGPIIDMHLHALSVTVGPDGKQAPYDCYPKPCQGVTTAAASEDDVLRMTVEAMDQLNIVLGFLSGDLERVEKWTSEAPGLFIASPFIGPPGKPSVDELRRAYAAGRLTGMGEIATQYYSYAPNDPALEPYFALAEEFDVPVNIHTLGIGAPLAGFRVAKGDPTLLEDVLVRHPNLRLFVENCGFPFASEMVAMMYQYPQLHCEVSTITWIIHREAFLDFLERLIRAGLEKRIMFGSDQSVVPETISMAVEAVQSAEFLTREQKADIFYNNAARFLRLNEEEIARHHGR